MYKGGNICDIAASPGNVSIPFKRIETTKKRPMSNIRKTGKKKTVIYAIYILVYIMLSHFWLKFVYIVGHVLLMQNKKLKKAILELTSVIWGD